MKPAVSECNISMFREQDLSFNLRSSFWVYFFVLILGIHTYSQILNFQTISHL